MNPGKKGGPKWRGLKWLSLRPRKPGRTSNKSRSGFLHNPFSRNIPATGAWRQGDPPGNRKFFHFDDRRRFVLECGSQLDELTVAYETWGTLNESKSNAILICHALTGDSHVSGEAGAGHATPGWWSDVVGEGKAIDTDRYFVVGTNVLGGCQGTTGPSSINPGTGRPYGPDFPVVTIRDMVRVQEKLTNHLGIGRWLSIIGGSMGGMQVLEWSTMFPDRLKSAIPIATTCAASSWQIALSAIGRRVIVLDPCWNDGNYYDAGPRKGPRKGPHEGLAAARAIGMVSYRNAEIFEKRFPRKLVDPYKVFGKWDRFLIEGYLDHQGEKLVDRFDANSYILLNKAMDLHDLGGRHSGDYPDSLKQPAARIGVPVLCLSINSDILYPPRQQHEIVDVIRGAGGTCELVEIDSPHGHDGFLLEPEQVGSAVAEFLGKVAAGEA